MKTKWTDKPAILFAHDLGRKLSDRQHWRDEWGITATTTDDELAEIADEWSEWAKSVGVDIFESLNEFLQELRDTADEEKGAIQ